MLELDSACWSELFHAYGDASDLFRLIEQLRHGSADWRKVLDEDLMPVILHSTQAIFMKKVDEDPLRSRREPI